MPVTSKNYTYTRGDTFSFNCLAQDYQQNIIDLTSVTYLARAGFPFSSTFMEGFISNISIPNGTFTVTFQDTVSMVFPAAPVDLEYFVQVSNAITGVNTTVQAGKIYLTPFTL